MSWNTMLLEIAAQVPVAAPHARNLVNRAWLDVQRQYPVWSFLYGEAAIPSIIPILSGVATVTIGSPYVGCDATLIANLNALPLLLGPTLQCFRVGTGTIYRIVAYNNTNAAIGPLPANSIQLDKLYADSAFGNIMGGAPPGGFQIFTCYVNAPTSDFLWWESVKDPVNGFFVSTTVTRERTDTLDPQRFQSGWPRAVVPYIVNPTPGNFFGYPMYEIWPAPLNNQVLVGTYFRSGLPFQNLTDTVLPPLGEDVVLELSKMYAYEWCIANPDKVPKGGYQFLYNQTQKNFMRLIDDYIRKSEAFGNHMMIENVEPQFLDSLPWISQKQAIGYFPT